MSKTGTVKRYDRKRGFGFIAPKSGGEELFIHWTNITSDDKWPSLKKDMAVKYDTMVSERERDDGKIVACNVTDASGSSISLGDESDHKLSNFTVKGTVKFFAKKGYGFITTESNIKWPKKCPAGTDVFVSRENLVCADGSVCTLRKGTKVAFKVFKKEGKDDVEAAEVTDEDGSPLNFEARDPSDKPRRPKGKKKGSGKGKSGVKGVKTKFSKLAKSSAQGKRFQSKKGSEAKFGGKAASKGGKVFKSKGGSKGVKKTIQKQQVQVVYKYVEVPVYKGSGKGKAGKGGKGSKGGFAGNKKGGKAGKSGGKGGQNGSKGGKSGRWQLVPKKKNFMKSF